MTHDSGRNNPETVADDDSTENADAKNPAGAALSIVLIGVAAGVVIFTVMFGIVAGDHAVSNPGTIIELQVGDAAFEQDNPETSTLASWGVYATHFVPLEIVNTVNGETTTVNPITNIVTTIPGVVLYLLPVSVLVPSGYIAARRSNADARSLPAAILSAGGISVGYAPVMFYTAQQSTWSIDMFTDPITYSVPTTVGVFAAGVCIPLAYAGIGGAVAYARHKDTVTNSERTANNGDEHSDTDEDTAVDGDGASISSDD